jgi:hypothetical protein
VICKRAEAKQACYVREWKQNKHDIEKKHDIEEQAWLNSNKKQKLPGVDLKDQKPHPARLAASQPLRGFYSGPLI